MPLSQDGRGVYDVGLQSRVGYDEDNTYSIIYILWSRFVPIGLKTFTAQSKTSGFFQSETVTHFYQSHFLPGGPAPDTDISACLSDSDQIFIKVRFHIVNNTESILNHQNSEYSFGALISNITGVSTTQIRKLYLKWKTFLDIKT